MGLLDTMTADKVVRHGVKVFPHVVEPKPQTLTASVVVWWLAQMSPDALESVARQIVTADRAKAEYLDDALHCALGDQVRTAITADDTGMISTSLQYKVDTSAVTHATACAMNTDGRGNIISMMAGTVTGTVLE